MLHSSPEYYYTISRVSVFFSLHVFHDTRLRIGKLLWILFKHCHVCLMWALILRKWNIRENNFCSDFVLLKHQGHQPNTYISVLWYVLCILFFLKWCLKENLLAPCQTKCIQSLTFLFPFHFIFPNWLQMPIAVFIWNCCDLSFILLYIF